MLRRCKRASERNQDAAAYRFDPLNDTLLHEARRQHGGKAVEDEDWKFQQNGDDAQNDQLSSDISIR